MRRNGFLIRAGGIWSAMLLGSLLATGLLRGDTIDVSSLTLVGVAEADGVTYASLYDPKNGEHFLASTKSGDGRFELLRVTVDESAIIRQNGRSFLLRMDWPAAVTTEVAGEVARPSATVQHIPLPGSVEATAPTPPPGEKLPLVFQTGDLAKLNLNEGQRAAIARLRQQFVAALGGSGAAVTPTAAGTPTEENAAVQPVPGLVAGGTSATEPPFQNWLTAQEKSDAEFVMLFGQEAFNLSQMGAQAGAAR